MVSKKNAGVSEEAGAGLELAGAASGSCERFDVVIVGCGSSGLYTALNLPAEMSVLVLTKTEAKRCDSMLAQGGICVLLDEDDYDSFYEDTMRAGHYENRPESVDIMIRSSRAGIRRYRKPHRRRRCGGDHGLGLRRGSRRDDELPWSFGRSRPTS